MGRIKDMRLQQIEDTLRKVGPSTTADIAARLGVSDQLIREYIHATPTRFKCVRIAGNGPTGLKALFDVIDSSLPEARSPDYTRTDAFGILPETEKVLDQIMRGICVPR